MYEAIKALEAAEVLTWVNRLIRVQYRERDLFGRMTLRSRLVRTSNAYVFRDPLPCASAGVPGRNAAVSSYRPTKEADIANHHQSHENSKEVCIQPKHAFLSKKR